mmetsp:Transcript_5167/g.6420  ORF Transcript_5167/g.6420 Transcript_5167/m.6420 type:complete len:126 (-) Transcript_5167:39-416(-)
MYKSTPSRWGALCAGLPLLHVCASLHLPQSGQGYDPQGIPQLFTHKGIEALDPGIVDELQNHVTIRLHRGRRLGRINGIEDVPNEAIIFGQTLLDGLFGFRHEATGHFGLDFPSDVDLVETPRSG